MTCGGDGARKRKSRLGVSHAQNDARYVATGRALALVASPDAGAELRWMNRGKNGRPYKYPESLIMTLAGFRSYCGLSFRVCEGFAVGQLGGEGVPHFTQIWRRMNALDVSFGARAVSVRGRNGVLNLSIDGTGMSPSGRSEYIRFRHRVEHGFIRFVIVVDTDTRKILSFSITDETTGEAPQFKDLTLEALENAGAGAGAAGRAGRKPGPAPRGGGPKIVMRADGGFDSRPIFALCDRLGITPYIRVGINSATRSRGVNRARTRAVLDQLGGGIRDPPGIRRTDQGREGGKPQKVEEEGRLRQEMAGRDCDLVVQEAVRGLRACGTLEVHRAGDGAQGEPLQHDAEDPKGGNGNDVGTGHLNAIMGYGRAG